MYRSVDGRNTWTSPQFLAGATRILDVKVDASQGSTPANDIVLVGTDVGLFRSADGGATYTRIHDVDTPFGSLGYSTEVWSLANTTIDGGSGWVASVASWAGCTNCTEYTLIYYSLDHGATWDFAPDSTNAIDFSRRTTLAVGAPGDTSIYAFSANNNGSSQLDMYRSTDGGLNWTALGMNAKIPTNPNVFNPNMNLMHGQAWYTTGCSESTEARAGTFP